MEPHSPPEADRHQATVTTIPVNTPTNNKISSIFRLLARSASLPRLFASSLFVASSLARCRPSHHSSPPPLPLLLATHHPQPRRSDGHCRRRFHRTVFPPACLHCPGVGARSNSALEPLPLRRPARSSRYSIWSLVSAPCVGELAIGLGRVIAGTGNRLSFVGLGMASYSSLFPGGGGNLSFCPLVLHSFTLLLASSPNPISSLSQSNISLRRARFGGVITSLVFTYGGYLTSFPVQQITILEVSAWLPWVMWGSQRSGCAIADH